MIHVIGAANIEIATHVTWFTHSVHKRLKFKSEHCWSLRSDSISVSVGVFLET